jgi:Glycosyltransferase family 25 (LPS biosynthesis protein)
MTDDVGRQLSEKGRRVGSSDRIPTFVVNLASDAARRDNIIAQFSRLSGFDLNFVVGVDGGDLPDQARYVLTRSENWIKYKGTIGCFLSHVKAWEEAARCTAPFAVILEDDVDVRGLHRLASLTRPDDAEFIFLNDRLTAGLGPSIALNALPMSRALTRIDAVRCGPGGDGYLVTPACASALVAACRKDLFYGHVDGRLLRYATSEEDLAAMPSDSWIAGVIRNHHHPTLKPQLGLVRGYCLSEPLVHHRGVPSSRESADQTLQSRSA